MTLAALIDTLTLLDASVVEVNGKAMLRLPKGTDSRAVLKSIGDDLVVHRDGVIAHFAAQGGHPGRECAECGSMMYHDSAEEQWRFCGTLEKPATVKCPAAPGWAVQHARDAAWQATRLVERKAKADAPVDD